MRYGRKVSRDSLVVYASMGEVGSVPRFGFVVGKSVGGAVERNLVKRRMRAVARQELAGLVDSTHSIVVRALPTASATNWNKLQAQLSSAIQVAVKRSGE